LRLLLYQLITHAARCHGSHRSGARSLRSIHVYKTCGLRCIVWCAAACLLENHSKLRSATAASAIHRRLPQLLRATLGRHPPDIASDSKIIGLWPPVRYRLWATYGPPGALALARPRGSRKQPKSEAAQAGARRGVHGARARCGACSAREPVSSVASRSPVDSPVVRLCSLFPYQTAFFRL
jgi:hypothetical protein